MLTSEQPRALPVVLIVSLIAWGCRPIYADYPAGGTASADMEACERGDGSACKRLGEARDYGYGLGRDEEQAEGYYQRSCYLGYLPGCVSLAIHQRDLKGVDPQRPFRLLLTTCERGGAMACVFVGYEYAGVSGGNVVPRDHTAALRYFERACALGDSSGCNSAAYSYRRGEGTGVDLPAAAVRFRRACDLGHGQACLELSQMLTHGAGIPKDEAEGQRYWDVGCEIIGIAEPCVAF